MRVEGQPGAVRAGDLLLCTTPGSWFSGGIRWAEAGSQASHAALVTRGDPAVGLFEILEVGARIREARIDEFPGREWVAYRPTVDGKPIGAGLGWTIARDTLALLSNSRTLGALYPAWKLPLYLLRRDWRGKLLLSGPRQVCSVTSIRAAIAHGVEVWAWEGDNRRELLSHDDIESITPADLARNAVEQGWIEVAWTPCAPII